MRKESIKIGKKVKYYPILNFPEFILTEIKSEPWECCGSVICKVADVSGGVSIENLIEC